MKVFSKIIAIVICTGFLLSTTSCVVLRPKDNGKHKGWYKNKNNPHNPKTKKKWKEGEKSNDDDNDN